MSNDENLKSLADRTTEEKREIGIKGGKASGEARRRKRDLKLAMQTLLESDVKLKDGEIVSGAEAIAAAQYKKALKGDPKAFELIRDTSGQKPVEKVEQVNIDGEHIELVNELKAYFNESGTEEHN